MAEPRTIVGRFLARGNDDPVKVVGIAFLVAFTCALVVSSAAIALKPRQEAHLEAERAARMAAMLDRLPGMAEILAETGADSLTTRLVDLASGDFVDGLDPDAYDAAAAAADPATGVPIPPDVDSAALRQRAPYAPVHILERGGRVELVVLPVYGNGSNVRDWLYVEDHCRGLALALASGVPGETYVIGGKCEMRNIDVVHAIIGTVRELAPEKVRRSADELITFVKDRPGHDRRYAIDPSRIERALGWAPRENFASGLRRTVEWYLEHEGWIRGIEDGSYRGERLGNLG